MIEDKEYSIIYLLGKSQRESVVGLVLGFFCKLQGRLYVKTEMLLCRKLRLLNIADILQRYFLPLQKPPYG